MEINFEQKFNIKKLLKFAIPSILMMILLSLYTAVDGLFISKYIGSEGMAGLNIIMPIIEFSIALAMLFATGSSAVIGRLLGEGKREESNRVLSSVYIIGLIMGVLTLVMCILFKEKILILLGVSDSLMQYASSYYDVIILFIPALIFQSYSIAFMNLSDKSVLGMSIIIFGGVCNVILDYLFIFVMGWGMTGAAIATGVSYVIPSIFSILYLAFNKKGILRFQNPLFSMNHIVNITFNGSSEFITNLAIALTTFLLNISMLKYLGDVGVSAIAIILQLQFVLTSVYVGYGIGVAPIISYKFGQKNISELKEIINKSLIIVGVFSVFVVIIAFVFSKDIISIYLDPANVEQFSTTVKGFVLYLTSFLFIGLNVYITSIFTAINNGKVSALIAFVRTFIFVIGAIIILPNLFGEIGLWLAVPVGEFISFIFAFYIFKKLILEKQEI